MVRLEEEGDCGKNERKFPVSTRYPEEMEEAWEKTGLPVHRKYWEEAIPRPSYSLFHQRRTVTPKSWFPS